MTRIANPWLLPILVGCLPLLLTCAIAEEKAQQISGDEERAVFVRPPDDSTEKESSDKVTDFTCKDPLGVEHKCANLYSSTGMLVMITVPNLTQYERQQRWEKWVEKQKWPEHNGPQRVLIEDMSQQQMFKEKARAMMKARYDANGDVVVLIDETGCIRRQFGVNQNETVIFLVDTNGKIIHCEGDDVEPDRAAAARLIGQVRNLAENNAKTSAAATAAASTAAGSKIVASR